MIPEGKCISLRPGNPEGESVTSWKRQFLGSGFVCVLGRALIRKEGTLYLYTPDGMQGSLVCLSRHHEPLDENQLSQLGVVPCWAKLDLNVSYPGFAGICAFSSSDDKLIALASCHLHSLPAEMGWGGVYGRGAGRGGQSFWWARLSACFFFLLTGTGSVALNSSLLWVVLLDHFPRVHLQSVPSEADLVSKGCSFWLKLTSRNTLFLLRLRGGSSDSRWQSWLLIDVINN